MCGGHTFMILGKTFRTHIGTEVDLLEGVKVDPAGLDESIKVVHVSETRLLLLKAVME